MKINVTAIIFLEMEYKAIRTTFTWQNMSYHLEDPKLNTMIYGYNRQETIPITTVIYEV